MFSEINGRQLLDALADLKEPARLTDIARHLANDLQPERQLLKTVKSALDAGVRYGYVEKNNYFYSVKDADAEESDSAESVASLGDVKNSASSESETSKTVPEQRTQLATASKSNKKPQDDGEIMSSAASDKRSGMRRRRVGVKRRRSRSRSNRSTRRGSRRRR